MSLWKQVDFYFHVKFILSWFPHIFSLWSWSIVDWFCWTYGLKLHILFLQLEQLWWKGTNLGQSGLAISEKHLEDWSLKARYQGDLYQDSFVSLDAGRFNLLEFVTMTSYVDFVDFFPKGQSAVYWVKVSLPDEDIHALLCTSILKLESESSKEVTSISCKLNMKPNKQNKGKQKNEKVCFQSQIFHGFCFRFSDIYLPTSFIEFWPLLANSLIICMYMYISSFFLFLKNYGKHACFRESITHG